MEQRSIVIVGAGISGLSAGCYRQMNGRRTQTLEMHRSPGGLCTSWRRKGYTIEGCLHWLADSRPGTNFYRIWQELGAVQGRHVIDRGEFLRVEGKGSQVFIVCCDLDRLQQHMKEPAPQDVPVIEELTRAARTCAKYDLPGDKTPELYGPVDGSSFLVRMYPFPRTMSKWKRITLQDYARRFSALRDSYRESSRRWFCPEAGHPAGAYDSFWLSSTISAAGCQPLSHGRRRNMCQ